MTGPRSISFNALISLLCVSLCIGCVKVSLNSNTEDKKVAHDAAVRFNDLLQAGEFEAMYELIDDEARRTKSREAFLERVKQVHDAFGKIRNEEIVDQQLTTRALDREVTIILKIDSANGGYLERTVWRVADGKARLFTFYVEPTE